MKYLDDSSPVAGRTDGIWQLSLTTTRLSPGPDVNKLLLYRNKNGKIDLWACYGNK